MTTVINTPAASRSTTSSRTGCRRAVGHPATAVGDIVNIDVTPKLNGCYGDTSRTDQVSAVSVLAMRLVGEAYEAMMAEIYNVRLGARLGNVGAAMESVTRLHRFASVRNYCGHDGGQVFHNTRIRWR